MRLLEVGLDVHAVPLDLRAADLAPVDVGQDLVLPDTDTSLLSVRHLVTVDQVDSEGEVSVVDVEAVGALVHGAIAPLGRLLGPYLAALVHDVAVPVLDVVQLHVGLVIRGDGHIVLRLHVGQKMIPEADTKMSSDLHDLLT